jgi:hypothetical protein
MNNVCCHLYTSPTGISLQELAPDSYITIFRKIYHNLYNPSIFRAEQFDKETEMAYICTTLCNMLHCQSSLPARQQKGGIWCLAKDMKDMINEIRDGGI